MPQPSTDWLNRFRDLYPTDGIVIVGAGSGADALTYAGTGNPVAVLIEANEAHASKLSDLARHHKAWSIHSTLVLDENREVDFHIASNPNESSVLSPMTLVPLWRNLTIRQQDRRSATTLGQLIASPALQSQHFNWIVVDCLPSLPILNGADRLLLEADVLIARVVLNDYLLPRVGASKIECDLLLATHGFRCVDVRLERQPMVGKALYIRDWKAIAKSRWDTLHAHKRDAEQANLEKIELEKGTEAQRQSATLHIAEMEALKVELQSLQQREVSLEKTVNSLEAELAAALASLDEKEIELVKLHAEETQRQESLAYLKDELKVATDSMSDWEERALQATAINDKFAQDLKEQQRQTNHWNQQVDAMQSTTTALSQSISDLKKENRELQQAVRLANKLQILSEADVTELRGRYEIALRAQEQQHGLLVELEGKLHVAASYFRRLQNTPASAEERLIVNVPTTEQEPKRGNDRKAQKKTPQRDAARKR